jgi:predicted nucleotidyltransferase
MLKIINELALFCEDNYRRIHVRQYARLNGISPPTASKLLQEYEKEGLLRKEIDKGHYCYFADRESHRFADLNRIYWKEKIFGSGLVDHIKKETISPIVVLFGSAAKSELTEKSDIDIAIFTQTKKALSFAEYEKRMKRTIQAVRARSVSELPESLRKNVMNGMLLYGRW